MEIAFGISASNELKIEANNSAAQWLMTAESADHYTEALGLQSCRKI